MIYGYTGIRSEGSLDNQFHLITKSARQVHGRWTKSKDLFFFFILIEDLKKIEINRDLIVRRWICGIMWKIGVKRAWSSHAGKSFVEILCANDSHASVSPLSYQLKFLDHPPVRNHLGFHLDAVLMNFYVSVHSFSSRSFNESFSFKNFLNIFQAC